MFHDAREPFVRPLVRALASSSTIRVRAVVQSLSIDRSTRARSRDRAENCARSIHSIDGLDRESCE